jgi:hypothetical protein
MDIVKLDVPLFIRLLELAREDVKQDADLHDIAEAVIKLSQDDVATMADYNSIVSFMNKQGMEEANEPKMVKDRKTGKEYNPDAEFNKLLKDPKTVAQFKRMAQEKGKGWPTREDHSPEDPNASYNVGEYDREGDMSKDQLRVMNDAAQELYDILDANDNLPEWVQKKITLAVDYVDTVRDYMKANADNYGKTEAVDELDRIKQLGGIR